jgi:hypothetical protein
MKTKVKKPAVLTLCWVSVRIFLMQLAYPDITYMPDNGEFTLFVALLFWTLYAFINSSGILICSGSKLKKSLKFKGIRSYKTVKFLRLLNQ